MIWILFLALLILFMDVMAIARHSARQAQRIDALERQFIAISTNYKAK
jgi:hypothetical protein